MSRLESLMYLQINLLAVILIVIVRHRTQGISQMVAQRNFANAIDAMVVFFLSDTLCTLMTNGLIIYNKFFFLLCKNAYFLSTTLMCYFWFVYFEYLQESIFVNNRRNVWLSSILVWIMVLLLIINRFNGILFYFDKNEVYHRGPFFIALYLLSYIYVLFSSFRALIGIFQKEKAAKRKTLISLALFPIPPAIGGISQYFYPNLPVACSLLSLEVLIMYLNWVEEMVSIDPLTHLNNRKQFIYHFEHRNPEADDYYIMMIDANKFKSINDNYGHIEGDAALLRIAEALRLSFKDNNKRASIARYGGDEFIVLLSAEDQKSLSEIVTLIRQNLKELNDAAKAPYDLKVSIGIAKVERGVPLRDLISAADEELYIEKRN